MRNILANWFGRPAPEKTSSAAKERLMFVISHEAGKGGTRHDFLPELKTELMALLAKYLPIDQVDAQVQFAEEDGAQLLKVDIVLPE